MTINEIAKLAGVSRATVSRYINNGYVSIEKEKEYRKLSKKQDMFLQLKLKCLEQKKQNL